MSFEQCLLLFCGCSKCVPYSSPPWMYYKNWIAWLRLPPCHGFEAKISLVGRREDGGLSGHVSELLLLKLPQTSILTSYPHSKTILEVN